MIGIALCFACFLACWMATRRSPAYGLIVLFAIGYAYGIVRANLLNSFTYFIFDAAVAGFYLAYGWRITPGPEKSRLRSIAGWTAALIVWPFFVCLIPFQTPLVTLVGLRGNIFLLPFLLVGARLRGRDLKIIAYGLAILNLAALAIAGIEYVQGVHVFYPVNAVTAIIYNSNDVAGYKYLRIPATFVTAHAYGGTLAATLPLLIGLWGVKAENSWLRWLALGGIVAAAIGVLLSATRVNFIEMMVLAMVAVFTGTLKGSARWILIATMVVVGAFSLNNERMTRFKNLSETSSITQRINGSVNRTFFEILTEYPLGNGLGGGGTSIPEFLASEVHRPIAMESEYARILLEQGVPGLLLWVTFFGWALVSRNGRIATAWQSGRRLALVTCISSVILAFLGTGTMTSIPQTVIVLLYFGWISTAPAREEAQRPGRTGGLAARSRRTLAEEPVFIAGLAQLPTPAASRA